GGGDELFAGAGVDPERRRGEFASLRDGLGERIAEDEGDGLADEVGQLAGDDLAVAGGVAAEEDGGAAVEDGEVADDGGEAEGRAGEGEVDGARQGEAFR